MTALRPTTGHPTSTPAGDAPDGDDQATIGERLTRLVVEDRASGASLLVATAPTTAIDPIALFAAAVEADLEVALWLRPADGVALVGVGRAWAMEGEGPDRFAAAEAAWRGLLVDARADGSAQIGRAHV